MARENPYYRNGFLHYTNDNDELVCVPEEVATQEELEIIRQIKEDIAAQPPVESEPVVVPPTTDERLSAIESAIAALMGV